MSSPAAALDLALAATTYSSAAGHRTETTRALFVELVGLPGAGKTTVARAAAQRLRAAGLRVAEDDLPPVDGVARVLRYGRFALFCARNPRLVRAAVRYMAATRPRSRERLPYTFGILTHAFGAQEARRAADVVLISQGALQAAWSVAVNGTPPDASIVQELVTELMRATGRRAVVHVDADPAQAVARISGRTDGESRFDTLPAVVAQAQLQQLSAHLSMITSAVQAEVGESYHRLDAQLPAAENAAAIAEFVQHRALASVLAESTGAMPADEAAAAPRRRIALFVPSLDVGGAERVLVNLSAGFVRRGLAVDLVLIHRRGIYLSQVPPEVRIITLSGNRVLFAIPSLARYLRRERPEALLATLTYANIAAVLARRIAGVATRVTVREANALTKESAQAGDMKDRQLPRGARWFYPWADAIVAVSAGAADSLVTATGTPRARVHVLDNPIVTPDLPALAAAPVAHPWLSTDHDRPVIVAAGRLTAQKDYPTLLRAFAELRSRRAARLIILGEGELRASLEQLVRELGIEADVSLPGVMKNPFAYMARAAVFVLSSAWEGSPGVLIQAMASGAPVIATDCESGPREILRDGEFGTLVTVGDVTGLAAAIDDVLSKPRRSPPPASWHRFSVETSVDAYLEVLGVC